MRTVDAFFFTAAAQADEWRRRRFIKPAQPVYELLESSTRMCPVSRSEARRSSGVDGDPALLWVGRLNGNKDPLTVLEGFGRIVDDWPAATLTIVSGGGDLAAAVEAALRASPRMASRVRLAGEIPHAALPAYYSAADLFVLGSHREGSGYALLEACACGAVPVVTDIPAFNMITGGGAIGALWVAGQPASFDAAVRRLLTTDLTAHRTRVLERFDGSLSWRAVGRQALSACQDVVARRKGR
jgi:glycosyltransferase involved in cell wall biosynthesis